MNSVLFRAIETCFEANRTLDPLTISLYKNGFCDFECAVGDWLLEYQGTLRLGPDYTLMANFLTPSIVPKLMASSLLEALLNEER